VDFITPAELQAAATRGMFNQNQAQMHEKLGDFFKAVRRDQIQIERCTIEFHDSTSEEDLVVDPAPPTAPEDITDGGGSPTVLDVDFVVKERKSTDGPTSKATNTGGRKPSSAGSRR